MHVLSGGRFARFEVARGPARQGTLKAPPRRLGPLRHPRGVRVREAAVDECDGRRDISLVKPYQGLPSRYCSVSDVEHLLEAWNVLG